MAGDRPAGVDDRQPNAGRVARALARYAARQAGRQATRRGLRALLAKASASTAQAAASNPAAAAWIAAVLAAVAVLLVIAAFIAAVVIATATAASAACSEPEPASGTIRISDGEPPRELIPWLIAAANQPSAQLGPMGPAVLAGIAKVESDFGRSSAPGVHSGVNFAGCCAGPFQFNLRDTWAGYADDPGADADGDGVVSVYSFPDAAFAAARKLASQGAPEDWNAALLAYNRSTAYVRKVLDYAKRYQGPIADSGAAGPTPLDEAPPPPPECGGQGGRFGAASLDDLSADPLERIIQVADWIEAQRFHYCFGGGHDPRPGPDRNGNDYCYDAALRRVPGNAYAGIDCSGSVRWLLVLAGYPDPGPLHSSQFAHAYPRGPGKHVTIWSNNGHVFVTINGRDWGTSKSNYASGPGWHRHGKNGFVASHPPGL